MTRKERFIKRIEEISNKFDNNIILNDDVEYVKSKDLIEFKCIKHDIVFKSTVHNLTDTRVTCGCPICRNDKLLESAIKSVEVRKKLKDNV